MTKSTTSPTRLSTMSSKAALSLALALALAPIPALSQQQAPCGPSKGVIASLKARYGETPAAFGLMHNGSLFQIFATPDGKTWTAVVATPEGQSCIVNAGQGWEGHRAPLPGGDPF